MSTSGFISLLTFFNINAPVCYVSSWRYDEHVYAHKRSATAENNSFVKISVVL